MKKIYLITGTALLSVSSFAQVLSSAGKSILVSSKPFVYVTSPDRIGNPDTTGLINFVDFLPNFAPSGSVYNFGYSGGGYVYGNNVSANLKICAQGYQNITPTPVKVIGAIAWFVQKQNDLGSSATSKVVIKSYAMAANRSANTTGSGTLNQTLNWPGPVATASATADILFSDIDTVGMNYVAFLPAPTFTADFAIAADFSTLVAGDTAGLFCDKPFIASGTGAGPGDAGNMDYAFHYYASLSKWVVSDQLFSPQGTPDLGSGKMDNNIALFAVLADATGVNEYFNGMKLTTYPNPSVEKATIEYTLETNSNKVSLVVFDQAGRKIIEKAYDSQSAGTYKIDVETANLNAGTYLYQLNANGRNFTKQFVVSK